MKQYLLMILLFSLSLSFFSCNENQSEYNSPDINNAPTSNSDLSIDTSSYPPLSGEKAAMVERDIQRSVDSIKRVLSNQTSKYKSLAQIMRKHFSDLSTKEEVISVQGVPDTKQIIGRTEKVEVWVYGDCEIYFKGNYVDKVDDRGCSTLKYLNFGELVLSKDYIEKEFANFLFSRRANDY